MPRSAERRDQPIASLSFRSTPRPSRHIDPRLACPRSGAYTCAAPRPPPPGRHRTRSSPRTRTDAAPPRCPGRRCPGSAASRCACRCCCPLPAPRGRRRARPPAALNTTEARTATTRDLTDRISCNSFTSLHLDPDSGRFAVRCPCSQPPGVASPRVGCQSRFAVQARTRTPPMTCLESLLGRRLPASLRPIGAPPTLPPICKDVGGSKTEHPSRDVAETRPADTPPAAAANSRLHGRRTAGSSPPPVGGQSSRAADVRPHWCHSSRGVPPIVTRISSWMALAMTFLPWTPLPSVPCAAILAFAPRAGILRKCRWTR